MKKTHGVHNLFQVLNYAVLAIIGIVTIYPFLYVLTISLLPTEEYLKGGIFLFPTKFSIESYKYIFQNEFIYIAFKSSAIITVLGTFVNLALTTLAAYAMSKTFLKGYKFFINFFIFTMYFSGGLVPYYLLIKGLHLMDSYWAVILTGAVSTYYMLIMRSFFLGIPVSLEEAAIIDGATEVFVLIKIILPLSLPVMAAMGLFYAVDRWNSFFYPLIFLNDRKMWPIQVILREMLFESTEFMRSSAIASKESMGAKLGISLKMATIVFAIFPIAIVYPFLQKYFVKGVMLGAVKA